LFVALGCLTTANDEVDLSVDGLEHAIGVARFWRWRWRRLLTAVVIVVVVIFTAMIITTVVAVVITPVVTVVLAAIVAAVVVVDGVYAYPILFRLSRGQVLRCSQGTLLPSSVNPRYQIRGTNV
jgi:dolichyl-phosphate-mannose--protein O-mannosyl transferase